jgi:cyclic beta-1,2-glucan synthetase
MPNIFLPSRENTFSHEGLKYCLYCQSQYARKRKIPWGVSESAFFSFDNEYNYQYKAHGVGALALCRTAEKDTVISPYSSYLALPFVPKKAAANIKRLERLHLLGDFGLYEAADFTKERVRSSSFAAVKSYMAHHIGMSLLSVHNALNGFRIQNLFMRDIDMAAGKSLLDEKIPTGAPIFKKLYRESEKQKDVRRERFVKKDGGNPLSAASAYSNGEITVCVGADGVTRSTFLDKCIFRFDRERELKPSGVTAVFRTDGAAIPFAPYLDRKNADRYSCSFAKSFAEISYTGDGLKLGTRISVHGFLPCEKRVFTVQNTSKKSVSGELLIYFEPSLTEYEKEKSHPAFSHLFVTEDFDEKRKMLSFTRRGRTDDDTLCLSCRFEGETDFDYTCNRERVLKRPDGIFSLTGDRSIDFTNKTGAPDCCGLFSVRINLSPRERKSLSLWFATGKSTVKTKDILMRVGNGEKAPKSEAPCIIEPYSESGILLKQILPSVLFNCAPDNAAILPRDKKIGNVDVLWSLGISGDRPIILCVVSDISEVAGLEKIIKIHLVFNRFFIKNDLVIAYREDGAYSSPIRHEIRRITDKADKNSLFAVNLFGRDAQVFDTLRAFCSYYCDGRDTAESNGKSFVPVEINYGEKSGRPNGSIENGYFIGSSPVLPGCFIYSNSEFGALVSDKSLGFTYACNSFLNRLTGWSNDTRTDFDGERILALINGRYFDITGNCDVSFFAHRAEYVCSCDGVRFVTEVRVPENRNEKIITVSLKSDRKITVELCFCAAPVLSDSERQGRFITLKRTDGCITAENPMNADYKGKMYVRTDKKADFYIFDRFDFLSGNWKCSEPRGTVRPAAGIGKRIELDKSKDYKISFLLGFENGRQQSTERIDNRITISTPDLQLDRLFNTFLPVQTVRGRLQARAGFYQCSGAYGFRDQLQDALSLCILCPKMLKEQILLCAGAQFPEGDALHWFHLTDGGKYKGVRTRYSDDRLWLPYAVSKYVMTTGDRGILDIFVPFLNGEPLEKKETERYLSTGPSDDGATVFEHCIRAIEKSLAFGSNGLPLIFGGDWNDGFNAVGKDGKGESVWLGEFLAIVLTDFAALCDEELKNRYAKTAQSIKDSIDKNAWGGDRYIRAFYDDGNPLGDESNRECRLDSLSQSFAVFCNMPDKERKTAALESAKKRLADKENGIIKLFDGGFKNDRRAGYISAYPVGLRENGGQYTHAAVWLAMAFFRNGDADTGYELLRLLNPLSKYETENLGDKYMTEPYFLAGDVYARKGVEGRGGWSIYTGSSGWFYTAVYECLFGIEKRGNRIFFRPALPSEWKKASLTLRLDGTDYVINYEKSERDCLTVDGEPSLFLTPDGREHKIIVYFSGK